MNLHDSRHQLTIMKKRERIKLVYLMSFNYKTRPFFNRKYGYTFGYLVHELYIEGLQKAQHTFVYVAAILNLYTNNGRGLSDDFRDVTR